MVVGWLFFEGGGDFVSREAPRGCFLVIEEGDRFPMMKTNDFLLASLMVLIGLWTSDMVPLFADEGGRLKTEPLFDDFDGETLNAKRWLVARTQWGGKDRNGGVVPDNLYLEGGKLLVKGHGDRYTGPVKGVQRVGGKVTSITHGRRTGACLVTRECYASGRYEVRMKVPKEVGVCTGLWTFNYRRVDPNHPEYIANDGKGKSYISNHEIDIELPGRPGTKTVDIGYDWALLNTWVGERGMDMTACPTKLPFEVNDGKFHTWRFDWHTGDPEGKGGKVVEPRVDFYLDGQLLGTITTTVPVDAGQFWMGLWFPNQWAGEPDFGIETLEIDWVRITPFHEAGDRYAGSRAGPSQLLLGPEDWPKRLQPKKEGNSHKGRE